MQRFFDIFFSLSAIIILSPLLLLVVILLSLTGERKIFYLQTRIGQKKKKFKIYKFVTMIQNSENIGTGTITIKDDPRVLPLGKYLRITKINELPQIFNIFFGHMSIVGPRPLTKKGFETYRLKDREIISIMKPGLTGIGSIIFRNEEKLLSSSKNATSFYKKIIAPYKAKLEIWYSCNQNIKNYFIIIFATMIVVLIPKSNIIKKIFKDLPKLPNELKDLY